MAAQPPTEFYDGIFAIPDGMNSGVAPQLLAHTQLAYAVNCTVRGDFVTHRPPYRKIAVTLVDPTISLAKRFQGACYYGSDEGIGYLMALIGGRLYQIAPDTIGGASVYDRTINAGYPNEDPNPPEDLQAWLWQAENYVIVNNGKNRPLVFDGLTTTRSDIASYQGTIVNPWTVPDIGSSVVLTLDKPYTDAIGRFIQISQTGYFPFLMQVTAINGNTITAKNVTGWFVAESDFPANAAIASAQNTTYQGTIVTQFTMPAQGSNVTISVTPAYTGAVGDSLILTDGTGSLTTYTVTVVSITAGGTSLSVTNVNAPTTPHGLIVPVGFPILNSDFIPEGLPIGRMGAYVQGRNWISLPDGKAFIAGDLVGSSAGTAKYNFRDAVLKWSQNQAKFNIPGGAGTIHCIVAVAALDASLGQGPLQILCDNDIFTCSASTDAFTWADTKTPILSETVIGFGGCGQQAAVVCNSDLLFKSNDGRLRSLKLMREDFQQWVNLPISKEVTRILNGENTTLFSFISQSISDNRFLSTAQPLDSEVGTYGQGLVALDFDVTSSLRGKEPSVYDGFWNNLNVLQLVTGVFANVQRTFAFVANTTTNTVELWEILTQGNFDDIGNGPVEPITWSFETPVLFQGVKNKGEFQQVKLEDGEIYISDLFGTATFKVYYRPDFDTCWHHWHSFTVCANNQTNPNPEINQAQYRMRLGLGKPSDEHDDPTVEKLPRFGRFFQLRFEISGSVTWNGTKILAVPVPETRFARVAGSVNGETPL